MPPLQKCFHSASTLYHSMLLAGGNVSSGKLNSACPILSTSISGRRSPLNAFIAETIVLAPIHFHARFTRFIILLSKKIFLTTSRRTNYFYWIFSSSSVSYPGMSLGRRSDRYYFSKLFDFFVCTWVIDAVVVNMNELCCFVEYFVKKLSCWRIIIYNTIILSCKQLHLFSFHGMWDRLN